MIRNLFHARIDDCGRDVLPDNGADLKRGESLFKEVAKVARCAKVVGVCVGEGDKLAARTQGLVDRFQDIKLDRGWNIGPGNARINGVHMGCVMTLKVVVDMRRRVFIDGQVRKRLLNLLCKDGVELKREEVTCLGELFCEVPCEDACADAKLDDELALV